MAVSERGIVEVLDVVIGDGIENLRAEGFVHFVISAENRACYDVETVEFCDLMIGESGGMNEFLGWIERWDKGSVGESCVFSGREGGSYVAICLAHCQSTSQAMRKYASSMASCETHAQACFCCGGR